MTPSRGLRAALVVSLALLGGCSSSEEPPAASQEPTAEPSWLSVPTTSPEPEDTAGSDPAGTDAAEPGVDGVIDGAPATPRRAPHSVAAHFQNGLFTGDTSICDLLSPAARKDLLRTKVAEGAVAPGTSCAQYVRTFQRTHADWEVTVEAKIVEQTDTTAVVRVDMTLNHDVTNTRMELAPAGDTWEITDWGQH